jgi:ribosomal protein S18 acetylase RimI-like enzyme
MITLLREDELEEFLDFSAAHHEENGRDSIFSPAEGPHERERLRGYFDAAWDVPVSDDGWMKVWIARLPDDSKRIVGHVDLRARSEPSTSHRALLGIGILAPYRGRGLGRALMEEAIRWARTQPLAWIDLATFADNSAALALYRKLGFIETGRVRDLFRVRGTSITDVQMTLHLAL